MLNHLHELRDSRAHGLGVTVAAEIACPRPALDQGGGDRPLDRLGGLRIAEMADHHAARPDLADRIGDELAGYVGRGALHRLARCTGNWFTEPWNRRPASVLYSASVFSRTSQKSISPGLRLASGDGTPSNRRTGRRFTYSSKSRRIGISRPHSETWSGTPGQPTAPRKMLSNALSCSMPSSGIILPVCSRRSHDQSKSVNSSWKSQRRAAASSTRTPSGTVSLPIPSPGMSAILCLAMCFLLRRRTTYNEQAFRSKP